ncbi:acyltransferase [Xanthomonas melonis]|uniref:acyltransferase family protein n=1 Tax=Xanthomonas melonis TaxID=56456 RepID=UPI001E49B7F5|nr:acyltransferase family protein [Xanthomonas melonis]MCD0277448.1 acyltransferase [Xanthomonas melonis]
MQQNTTVRYRRDIDGLRALAVLLVVIYHFEKNVIPGGFVGVDIFFVISGYLITGIIYRDWRDFRILDFYARRIRRILPAATFVAGSTLVFGYFFLLPADVVGLSESVAATLLYSANVYFWLFLDTSYFAASSEKVPLLHMWSLGVEEQFYLVQPALMLFLLRIGGKRLVVVTCGFVAIASFFAGDFYIEKDPSFAYYMLPARCGEFLIGSLLSFWHDRRNKEAHTASNTMGFVGFILLTWAAFNIKETNGFPGLIALLPTIGAALLIASGANSTSLTSRLLSAPIFQYIGLRSYSLYLWHWPVLAFYRYAYGELTAGDVVICAGVIMLLTEFSYQLIETPFRHPYLMKRIKNTYIPIVSGCLVFSCALFLINSGGLLPTKSSKAYMARLELLDYDTKPAYEFYYNCQMSTYDPALWWKKECVLGDLERSPNTLLWGDSNAAHYIGYLNAMAEKYKFSFRNISLSACPPLKGDLNGLVPEKLVEPCEKFNQDALRASKAYKHVVIGASWEAYARFKGEERFESIVEELAEAGVNVVIALKIPVFRNLERMCESKSLRIPLMNCAGRMTYRDLGETEVNKNLMRLADKHPNVSFFGVRNQICRGGSCSALKSNKLIYFDRGHLSMVGSRALGLAAIEEDKVPISIMRLAE